MILLFIKDLDFLFIDRASGIGKLGISYGIGMVIGPLLGGFITDHFNEQTAAFMAALGSVLSIVIVIWTVPENTKDYNPDNRKTGQCLYLFFF